MNKKVGIIVGLVVSVLIGGTAIFSTSCENNKVVEESEETIVVKDRNGDVEVSINPETVVVLDYSLLRHKSLVSWWNRN